MNRAWQAVYRTGILVTAMFTAACASMYTPIPFNPQFYDRQSFAPASVQTITLLPVADVRVDHTETIHPKTMDVLDMHFRDMGYSPVVANEFGPAGTITEDDLEAPAPGWIRELGPAGAEWVFVFAVEDFVRRDKTFGSAHGVECAGYLFNRKSGRLVWRERTASQEGVGGLAGRMVPGYSRNFAQGACIASVLSQFPVRGDKRWMQYKQFIELKKAP